MSSSPPGGHPPFDKEKQEAQARSTTYTGAPAEVPPKPPSHIQHPSSPAKRGSRWWIWLLVILVVAYAGWRMFGHSAANTQAQGGQGAAGGRGGRNAVGEVPILEATATQGSIGVYVSALGAVTPVYTVTVTARVQGEIMAVHYREGQMVRKGDPLLDIDDRPYQAVLTQAEGQLAHDQAVLTEARIDLQRYQAAFARNAIAKQQMDDQEQVVKQSEGTVKNDEGAVAAAKINVVYCHIASPIDGRVGLRLVDPGNIVQANSTTPLVVVTQLQPITVIFNVAEDYLGQIQQQTLHGKTLTVDVFDRAVQVKLASGVLLTVDNQIDPTTGTVKLRAQFSNSDNALFPNQFVNARLLVTTLQNVTLIPTAAIQRNAQGPYVYVVGQNQTASIRQIKEGTTDGNNSSVDGLKAGEIVAVDGFDKLQDGVKVRVRQPGGSSNAAAGNGPAKSPNDNAAPGGKASDSSTSGKEAPKQ
jgi:membrane fusion protein, multidrug efflux system